MSTTSMSKNKKEEPEPPEKRYTNKFLQIISKNQEKKHTNLQIISENQKFEGLKIDFNQKSNCSKSMFKMFQFKSDKCIMDKPDFNGSNINKFLYCLNNTKYGIQNNVRVVCHSRLMKKFVHSINDGRNKNSSFKPIELDANIIDQNLWSMLINGTLINEKVKIIISRHGYTFANLLKQKGNKKRQILEKDARLSIYGILTALLHCDALKKIETVNEMYKDVNLSSIYVSVLSRTWMTAICLYLPSMCTFKKFNLIISPYLKENDFGLDNTPKEFTKQVNDIILFLSFLDRLHNYYKNVLQSGLTKIHIIIKENVDKIIDFFEKEGTICIRHMNVPNIINKIADIYYDFDITKQKKIFKIKNTNSNFKNFHEGINIKSSNILENVTIKIYEGENKPNNNNTAKFTRWCEPLSEKGSFTLKTTNCNKKLENINKLSKKNNTIKKAIANAKANANAKAIANANAKAIANAKANAKAIANANAKAIANANAKAIANANANANAKAKAKANTKNNNTRNSNSSYKTANNTANTSNTNENNDESYSDTLPLL